MTPYCSVVIPAFIPKHAEEALFNAFAHNLVLLRSREAEIIFVENGSKGQGVDVTPFQVAADVYVEYKRPLGFVRAFNAGVALAKSDIILQLNTDCWIAWNWWRLVDRVRARPGILSATPGNWGPEIPFGSLFAIHRDVLESVGPWDEKLNYRFCDQDYWIRTYLSGKFPVGLDTEVQVSHIDSISFKALSVEEEVSAEKVLMLERYHVLTYPEWIQKHGLRAEACW